MFPKPNLLDAVILLSGVNYSSVAKVVAAISAVSDKEGSPVPTWLTPDGMPDHPYFPDDDREAPRAKATADYVQSLIDDGLTNFDALEAPISRFLQRKTL